MANIYIVKEYFYDQDDWDIEESWDVAIFSKKEDAISFVREAYSRDGYKISEPEENEEKIEEEADGIIYSSEWELRKKEEYGSELHTFTRKLYVSKREIDRFNFNWLNQ